MLFYPGPNRIQLDTSFTLTGLGVVVSDDIETVAPGGVTIGGSAAVLFRRNIGGIGSHGHRSLCAGT